ncbi:leukocyte-associated immunoglobulin-like receptor 2 isoform X3 [Peromyscus maniculatus bairdii]|uniref:leukocyte-associated immunoglobulin-like receptor 2 isoform X3 n=1 Tax=Peromyscus maniculatus bairdii TaxID=230844 RepID=UPI003FCF8427
MVLGAALLALVCLMEQRIWAQHGPSPQPSIWAVPGAVISTGSAVTIFCRAPPGVTYVRLTHYVQDGKWFDCIPQGAQEVFEFSLQNMTQGSAGVYHCDYLNRSEWLQNNDTLELMVTESFTSDYRLENSIRLILAIILLLGLGALLLDAWKSRREPMGPSWNLKLRA